MYQERPNADKQKARLGEKTVKNPYEMPTIQMSHLSDK
jgi:hypothetical protein